MPLRYAAEPANGTALVRAGLNRLSTRTEPACAGRGVDFSALQVTQPHAVYDLRADAVANGGGLESAVFSGFRYLVAGWGHQCGRGGGADRCRGERDLAGEPQLRAVRRSPPRRPCRRVAALAPVSAGSYEVRALRFAAIGLMALWLKPDSGGADIIYPLAPAPAGAAG